ncbi:MAG: HAD-IA family hydrolase [Kineosporiaceae bacterium]
MSPQAREQAQAPLAGLILDWGGVLTPDLDASMSAWADRDGVRYGDFVEVLDTWLGRTPEPGEAEPVRVTDEASPPARHPSPVHLLEEGRLAPEAFEDVLAAELAARGSRVPARGLLSRMLADLAELDARMLGLVRRAREAGVRTAVLSNSWGEHYPDALFDELFDTVVISGRVGMRKPERRIFDHTAAALGLAAGQCVMVDDLAANVRAAVAAGMVGVLHTSVATTVAEVEILFDLA